MSETISQIKSYYAKRPTAIIGAAFGAGILLAVLASKKRHGTAGTFTRLGSPATRLHAGMERQKRKASEALGNIKVALAGVAATRVKAFVNEVVPAFQEHYARAKRERAAAASQNA